MVVAITYQNQTRQLLTDSQDYLCEPAKLSSNLGVKGGIARTVVSLIAVVVTNAIDRNRSFQGILNVVR